MPVLDTDALINNRIRALQDYQHKSGHVRAQVDVSGGLDSAVMLGLLARGLGPKNVSAVYSGINSSHDSSVRAGEVARAFDIKLIEIDATTIFAQLLASMDRSLSDAGFDTADIDALSRRDPKILGSIRSCLRAPLGRGINRLTGGGIRHGTSNECDTRFLRYFQKGGDGEVDTLPLGALSRGEVLQMARALRVPRSVLEATPSPDLHGDGDGHRSEDELEQSTGVAWTYTRIDVETGDYRDLGSIERMNRVLDLMEGDQEPLFADREPDWDRMVEAARPLFPEDSFDDEGLVSFLVSARKQEARTRHKCLSNLPTLGSRAELIEKGLITNEGIS